MITAAAFEDVLTADERAFFAADEHHDGWDQETGKPGLTMFSNALQVWAFMNGTVSVRQAAEAFKCEPAMIIGAVKSHYWMFLHGPPDDYNRLMIDHEGE